MVTDVAKCIYLMSGDKELLNKIRTDFSEHYLEYGYNYGHSRVVFNNDEVCALNQFTGFTEIIFEVSSSGNTDVQLWNDHILIRCAGIDVHKIALNIPEDELFQKNTVYNGDYGDVYTDSFIKDCILLKSLIGQEFREMVQSDIEGMKQKWLL